MSQSAQAFIVLAAGFLLLYLQALAAHDDKMLTPAQMQAAGVKEGLPFSAHGGMWGDAVLTLWLAFLVFAFGENWNLYTWGVAAVIGGATSAAMHEQYRRGTIREAHVKHNMLTTAGYLHFVYMWGAIAILVLFYLFTPNAASQVTWATTILLVVHVVVANHFVLGLLAPPWYPGRPFKSLIGWATVLGNAALLVFVTWAKFNLSL